MTKHPLRVVTFNFLPAAFGILSDWIQNNGHKHVLAVTTPGPISRPTPSYTGVVQAAPRHVDVLVSTRMKSVVTPVVRELKPDLILCFSFPYRITPELCDIPTFGAINLHPAVLPAYRGPNVFRPFYDNAPILGSTVHWIAPEYDTGRILSQKSAPMPDKFSMETIFPIWASTMVDALEEGVPKALAGDPGVEQDESLATYAAPYSEAEHQINWNEPARDVQRKIFAITVATGSVCRGTINDTELEISGATFVTDSTYPKAKPGDSLESGEGYKIVQTADAPLKVLLATTN